jgi:hypothetical protein
MNCISPGSKSIEVGVLRHPADNVDRFEHDRRKPWRARMALADVAKNEVNEQAIVVVGENRRACRNRGRRPVAVRADPKGAAR